jgi:hypothetical protein
MLKKLLFSLSIAVATLSAPAYSKSIQAKATPAVVVGMAFDWDNNVFEMPTQIMLFDKTTGEQRGVSTEEFALIRAQIGKPGTVWEKYELRPSPEEGSLRFFSDHAKEGHDTFANDVKKAMSTPGYHWKGPVWDDFVFAMKNKATAEQSWIITARLHNPKTIHDALDTLKKKGLFKNVLPEQNIWAVSYEGFNQNFEKAFAKKSPDGGAAVPSARKAAVMENILDSVNARALPPHAKKTLAASGSGEVVQHLWGFSDDD